ncbi:zincin [Rhizoclosmatium globosum]|uniref:Zincin n=1 Tax=Rhizoclosmatium globosum TaxID=329046 RepID=A0A1Y2CPJ7_9FUNG|nr:zincin [Rhizoclosmatium globosum]|eukprot:ORY48950.1 zincin [Rhizoclosmatium globosum]
MSAYRRLLLEHVKPRTTATAQLLCRNAKVAEVSAVDENSFVDVLLKALSSLNVVAFDSAMRQTTATSASHAFVRLRHALTPEAIHDLAEETIAYTKDVNDKVAALKDGEHTYENTLLPFAEEDKLLTPLATSFDFPQHTSANKALRDASSAADTKVSAFNVETSMRKDVFASIQKYAAKKEVLAAEDQRLLDRLIRDFKRNGLDLSEEKQARITAIKKEMSELGIQFSKNLGEENTKLHFTKEELDGMPDDFLEKLSKTEDGKFIVGLKYTEAPPVLKLCHVDTTRQAMEKAFNSRCKDTNTEILEKLVKLRQEQATILGFPNHASYILDVRMAKSPETVQSFLKDLNKKLQPLLDSDLAELLALKKRTKEARGEPFDGKLNQWDMGYYLNLIEKEKYQVDHEEIKRYFPIHIVTKGLFEIYQRLLSLKFRQVEDAEVWHEDVKMYAVHNSSDDSLVGYFYMDLHPRDGKYGHAAVFGLQPQAEGQLPVCALVANFSKPTATTPSLLLHSEVVTYFHEFGHVFHQLCSKVKHARFAGTAVERDFVECPSQMLENWCWEGETLNMLAGHIDDPTRKLPSDLLERLIKSKNANSGYTENRQLLFGLFDQAIHSGTGEDIRQVWPKMQQEIMGVPTTEGTYFPAAFGHLAGGYDAQYYGYMWSQVYATDMFYANFKEGNKLLDPTAGAAYRNEILAAGGSRDAIESLRLFLGREPSQDAFLKSKGL